MRTGQIHGMDLTHALRLLRPDGHLPLPLDQPFTHQLARANGLRPNDLTALVSAGVLRRPLRGVYVAATVPDSLSLRLACLRLVIPPDCVVCDRHAGWLHGAEMVLAPGEHLQAMPLAVFRPRGHDRLRNGLVDGGERSLLPSDVMEIEGVKVTTPLRTALDLGRVRWPERAIAALDAMLRLGAFEHEELLGHVHRFSGARWVRTLRTVAPLADARSESPGESVLRLKMVERRIPVEPQVEVWDDARFVARLDLADRESMFGGEYDGDEWHSTPEQRAHDRARRRDADDQGWTLAVFRKENVFGPLADVDRIAADAYRRARARRGLP